MIKLNIRHPYLFAFSLLILTELLSFFAYFQASAQIYLLIASFLAIFFISLFSLEIGVLTAAAELIIGSKGHLFSAQLFGFPISLRLIIWTALLLASLVFIFRHGIYTSWRQYGKKYQFWPFLIILSAFISYAIFNGLNRGHALATILTDANAWLYLGLLVPILLVYGAGDLASYDRLKKTFLLAVFWLSIKTLILLFIFSHNLVVMPDIYLWVRRSGIGEITAMGGGWQRIFLQSQIYLPIAFFLILWPEIKRLSKNTFKNKLITIGALSILLAVIIISMSRSFWLAFVCAGVIGSILSWQLVWKSYLKVLAYSSVALLAAMLLIVIIVKFPYPDPEAGLSAAALAARLDLNSNEAALASRWSLLPNLWQAIKQAPITGQGFGATVGYYSQDPRILAQHPDGWYTSYAFEWAYLDTWLKLGFLGLLAYLGWLFYLFFRLWQQGQAPDGEKYRALAISLLFLMIVNIFTPYLNHPLGLGFLLFSSCFIRKNPL